MKGKERLAGDELVFSLLGPVRGWRAGQALDLGSPQQRLVLVVLLLGEGRVVEVDRIADALWAEDVPRSGRTAVRTYVHRLRGLLGGEVITSSAGGYALAGEGVTVDLCRLRSLMADAEVATGDHERGRLARELHAALGSWQEPALAGLRGDYADEMRAKLAVLRLEAVERLATVRAVLGAVGPIDELAEAVRAAPLRERLRELLMRALVGVGRKSDALAVYSDFQRRLRAELRAEPSLGLRRLHAELIAGQPARGERAMVKPVPRLPADLPRFVGRAAELASVGPTLDQDANGNVVVITGMAGVGKSSLALHGAHEAAGHFPDGQVYVDLRGFDAEGDALSVVDVFVSVLESLGAGSDLPDEVSALASRYRSVLAERRCLLLFDNARDADQVLPLLPERSPSGVLVTSRARLAKLVAAADARVVALDVPPPAEARELLADLVGAARVAAEPEAAERIIEFCGCLPLALSLVGARARIRRELPLSAIAAELDESHGSLDAFAGADFRGDLRSVLECSYRVLSPRAARLFPLLAAHPAGELTVSAVAGIAGVPAGEVREVLGELVDANLVAEHTRSRLGWHDLVRAYASELLDERCIARRRPSDRCPTAPRALSIHRASRSSALVRAPRPS